MQVGERGGGCTVGGNGYKCFEVAYGRRGNGGRCEVDGMLIPPWPMDSNVARVFFSHQG